MRVQCSILDTFRGRNGRLCKTNEEDYASLLAAIPKWSKKDKEIFRTTGPIVKVKMQQLTIYRWQIISMTGFIVQSDISFHNIEKAEEYVRNYVSSFVGWSYDLYPLEETQTTLEPTTKSDDV
jgi:hypothetical protein